MSKKLLTILLIVTLTGFAALGFFYWQMGIELVSQTQEVENLLKQIDTLEKQIKDLKTKEEIPTDETATWKTYRNEEYGFEVKYPKDWEYYEDWKGYRPMGLRFRGTSLAQLTDVFVYENLRQLPGNSEGLPLKDWLAKLQEEEDSKPRWSKSDFSYEIFDLHDHKVYKVKTGCVGGYDIQSMVQYQDKVYRLLMTIITKDRDYEADLKIFNQMLSTFRFLE